LEVSYDYPSAGKALRESIETDVGKGVFRYQALLPVADDGHGLLAGNTPLQLAPRLTDRLGVGQILLKDDTRNPTRCLKDRASAVCLAMAQVAGSTDVYCASAGNAAISLAGFSAQRGIPCHVFVPSNASRERLRWLEYFGADVVVSAGDYDRAFEEAESEGRRQGWYSRNCAFNPFLVEGKKTVAFEIAEQLGWEAPDAVIAPVGDGCTLAAIGKGFRELHELNFIDSVPRLIGVQAEAMQPMVRRFQDRIGADSGETAAASINVRRPRNALRLLQEMQYAGGEMVAVPDKAIAIAHDTLAKEAGVVVEFTSASVLAGLELLAHAFRDATVVMVLTGGRVD
jgi:threonine synthase